MYSKYYTRFLASNQDKQHFACHSHYYWPDVTRDAMLEYWDDSARLVDSKWETIFGEKVPATQRLISNVLNLSIPKQIVFAPNTHEFAFRLLSCFDLNAPLRIVTTDSEFYSFNRQVDRISEISNVSVTKVPQFPIEDFEERMIKEIKKQQPQLVFFSHVFFNSGIAIKDLKLVVEACKSVHAMTVVDGYHAFMTLPTDLREFQNDIFYLSGSYKYAQGGEGCCFMHVPEGSNHRPLYTGWFAEFGDLSNDHTSKVSYAEDGMRFAGATVDFSALYRLKAVLEMFAMEGLTVERIHEYVKDRQKLFLEELDRINHPLINRSRLLMKDPNHHGGFLTFKLDSSEQVKSLASKLKEAGIITDHRADRLRFGFALYHEGSYDLSALRNI